MPGLPGHPHHLYHRFLRISQEEDFGVVNPRPDWVDLPILGDGYKLKASAPRYRPETNFGGYRQQVGIHHMLDVSGNHVMLAWPEVLGAVLDAALVRDAEDDLYSYTHDYYTPADPRRLLGAVAETLAIRVVGTGDADVQIETGWRAKTETRNAALVPGTFDYSGLSAVPFMFRDATLEIDTVLRIDIGSFALNVNNNVEAGPLRLGRLAYLIAGRREITLDIGKANLDADMNSAIRGGTTISFEADFVHPTWGLWQIKLPALAVEESEEAVSATEVTKESPRLVALAPDGVDILIALDVGPTTTTLEAYTTEAVSTTAAPETPTTTAAL